MKRRGIAIRIRPKNTHTKRFERRHPNSLWQFDSFEFRIKGFGKVYLFAIIDDNSRYCIVCRLCTDKEAVNSLQTLMQAIKKCGTPKQLLTDNGREFIESAFTGYLARKKIKHIKSKPYTPQSKGKIERFWRTVHIELIAKVMFESLGHAKQEIDKYITYYNNERRHGGIKWEVPIKRYKVRKEMIKERT